MIKPELEKAIQDLLTFLDKHTGTSDDSANTIIIECPAKEYRILCETLKDKSVDLTHLQMDYITKLPSGTRVKTTKDAGATDWTPVARIGVKWGAEGTVIHHSDSHGLCYEVEHGHGKTAWYESGELEVIKD